MEDRYRWKVSKVLEAGSSSGCRRMALSYNLKIMSKAKILYVEDELFLGKIVKESLESRNYEVVMESDGAKVLQIFKQFNPDICVLDVMLPNKDGFTIA